MPLESNSWRKGTKAFSVLVNAEVSMLSGFFIKKNTPSLSSKSLRKYGKCLSRGIRAFAFHAWIEHLPTRYRTLDSGLRKLRPVTGEDVPQLVTVLDRLQIGSMTTICSLEALKHLVSELEGLAGQPAARWPRSRAVPPPSRRGGVRRMVQMICHAPDLVSAPFTRAVSLNNAKTSHAGQLV